MKSIYFSVELTRACKRNDKEIVHDLLENGTGTEIETEDENFPLYYAVYNNNLDIITLLFKYLPGDTGESISRQGTSGYTPLFLASMNRNKIIINNLYYANKKEFIKAIDISTNYNTTPVYWLVYYEEKELINLFLKYSPNCLKKNILNCTKSSKQYLEENYKDYI